MEVIVTKHAMQRYAERVAKREKLVDINFYVNKNQDKIIADITKMYKHATFAYCGKFGTNTDKPVNVYVCGAWVILTGVGTEKIITLYKVDFHIGEEYNKMFVEKMLGIIEQKTKDFEEAKKKNLEERETYLEIVKANEALINEYKANINTLEELNRDYLDIAEKQGCECLKVEMELREAVENLCMKLKF